jgi:predicted RNA-binding protein YlxR (DUF448 family)
MAPESMRTCVGCRARAPKAELVRVARAPDGVRPDLEAVAPGRGAYVHRDAGCIDVALRRGALARALRTGLDQQELVRLRTRIEEALQER